MDVVAAADGGKQFMVKEKQMTKRIIPIACCAFVACLALLLSASTTKPEHSAGQRSPASEGTSAQKTFATPKEAADTLVQAAASFDVPALKEILGPE